MGTCVSCGGAIAFHRRYEFKTSVFRRVYGDRSVYRCTDCTLSQVDVAKVNEGRLGRYYEDQYRVVAKAGAKTAVTGAFWKLRADALAELVRDHLRHAPDAIFEVGAGYGQNLIALGTAYPAATLATDEVSHVADRPERIETASLDGGKYDVVIMSHVLEHFTDPKGLMAKVRDALTPGGIVVIEVPNDVDGIVRYNGTDEPHLTFFEAETLRSLLGRVEGLKSVEQFVAGPSVTMDTFKRKLRAGIRAVLYSVPIFSQRLSKRAAANSAGQNFKQRNPNGMFLRAVLTR